MYSSLAVALLTLATFVSSSVSVSLPRSLPQEYKDIGGGQKGTQAIAKNLNEEGIQLFQLANFLQNLEVDFFRQGSQNYSSWGSNSVNGVKNADVIQRIAAQAEIHVETVAQLLTANNAKTVEPCRYNFPVADEKSFLALASIITNFGIGVLIDLEGSLAVANPELETHVARIIPVKARWDSFFRIYAGEVPNPAAFGTRISAVWAYNLALDFIVPGSCHVIPDGIKSLPVYPDLALDGVSATEAATSTQSAIGNVRFTIRQPQLLPQGWESKSLWFAWVNEDNFVRYTKATVKGSVVSADVPPKMFGVVYTALTDSQAPDVGALTKATLAGPFPIPLGAGKY